MSKGLILCLLFWSLITNLVYFSRIVIQTDEDRSVKVMQLQAELAKMFEKAERIQAEPYCQYRQFVGPSRRFNASKRMAAPNFQYWHLTQRVRHWENPLFNLVNYEKFARVYHCLPENFIPLRRSAMQTFWTSTLKPIISNDNQTLPGTGWITPLESQVLYSYIRALKPHKIIEIGSGDSTSIILKAIEVSHVLDAVDYPLITSIEPFRSKNIPQHPAVTVLENLLQEVNLSLFSELQAGDLLFVDTSHTTTAYGDCLLEYLWLLPLLNPGVHVHIHDIFLPYDYHSYFMEAPRDYTEQWLLALLLRTGFEINWATHFMTQADPALFQNITLTPTRDSSFFIVKSEN